MSILLILSDRFTSIKLEYFFNYVFFVIVLVICLMKVDIVIYLFLQRNSDTIKLSITHTTGPGLPLQQLSLNADRCSKNDIKVKNIICRKTKTTKSGTGYPVAILPLKKPRYSSEKLKTRKYIFL